MEIILHCYVIVLFFLPLFNTGNLLDRIKDKESFDENEAKDFFSQILSAVMHLHSLNIVHRDLKVYKGIE